MSPETIATSPTDAELEEVALTVRRIQRQNRLAMGAAMGTAIATAGGLCTLVATLFGDQQPGRLYLASLVGGLALAVFVFKKLQSKVDPNDV